MLQNSFKSVQILKSGVFVLLVWLLLTPLAQAQAPEVINGLTCDLAHNHQAVRDIRNFTDDAGVNQFCSTTATCVCVQDLQHPWDPEVVHCAFDRQPEVCGVDQYDLVSQCFAQQELAGFRINGQLAANLSICFDQLDRDNDYRWVCGNSAANCPIPPDAIINMVGDMTIPVSTLYEAACDSEFPIDDKPPLERVCTFHLKPNACLMDAHCDDGNACTTDSCAPQTHSCNSVVELEDDHNVCTLDKCDPMRGITHTPIAGMNDGNVCTLDKCDPMRGIAHTPIAAVNDNNACTVDRCDPVRGQLHTPIAVMDDRNVCTRDSCDPARGVIHTPIFGCRSKK